MKRSKNNIMKVLLFLLAILGGIILLSYLVNPIKTNMISKTETMTTEEIQNVGQNAIITESVITERLTGTGPFDSNDTAGNDSSENNNIVRSFDQVTWTIENTMALKNNSLVTGLEGGRIKLYAELPESTANVVKWDLDSMKWAIDATVSEDGRIFTGYYEMDETKVTIPGKQNLVAVLKVLGAPNGMEIKPTFKTSLVGNDSGEEKTIIDSVTNVSAAPKYNITLKNNNPLHKEMDFTENGTTTRGRLYGYSVVLQLYNDNASKGLKGIEYPKGEITFDINMKMERVANGSSTTTDITSQATPILYNYKLNSYGNEQGTINGRPMNVGGPSWLNFWDVKTDRGSWKYDCYDSGTIHVSQQNSKLNVTFKDYKFNGVFPISCYDTYDSNYDIPPNVGCFAAGYIQILVPYTDATLTDNSTYYLSVSDENFSATSISNKSTTSQVVSSDDLSRRTFVRYSPGKYDMSLFFPYEFESAGPFLTSTYYEGDGKANAKQTFIVTSGMNNNPNNSISDDVYSVNSLLKFDGDAFEISEINGKTWDWHHTKALMNTGDKLANMEFQMLYAAKQDGSNWTSDDEMKNAVEEDLLFFTSLQTLKNRLGANAKCIGVLYESISGVLKAAEDVRIRCSIESNR